MAGTRGIATFRGEQLRAHTLRDAHFDENNKINENKIDFKWDNHREILENTKIDVFVQSNDKAVASLSKIDVTADIGARAVSTGNTVEGVVLSEKAQLRKTGTDSPIGDSDSDVVYGRLEESAGTYTLKFYSIENDVETPFTFAADAGNVDYRFVVRTNLSVIPVNAIIQGGAGFVEGATDAKAYMNLVQLMKDVYGSGGTLDDDGKANLGTNIVKQIADEVKARQAADTEIRNNLASTNTNEGAAMVGVVTDPNYTGITVQAVLIDLAGRLKGAENLTAGLADRDAATKNGYFAAGDFGTAEGRIEDLESTADAAFKSQADRLIKLETEDEEEVFEAVGGETEYLLTKGPAKDKTVLLFLNGASQAPGINFVYKRDVNGKIVGFDFAPDTLKVGVDANGNSVPDVIFVKYKKIL
ncbi:hypothetical protein IAQ67_29110 (plasmid) [Paenibacillus peoriae]|uniref:Uncharacterized protein n=1 Tax=Paenibacillus peoriae TaxID=59893 RepID=A0A7H0YH56_9BACL|nr:hypothetical protein [Paenibacillus peoriae]QNR70414.1 hypothetical protein IAQ67_29110 [Paenibacillus peoriae]